VDGLIMKKILLAVLLASAFGANAATHVVTINYTCGNHVIKNVGVKQDGADHWQAADKVTTNGVVVFNGAAGDTSYKSIAENVGITYFQGFQWLSDYSGSTEKDFYSNDGGATYHPCTSTTSVKRIE